MSAGDVASLAVSWMEGRDAKAAVVRITAEGVELDEVLDALVTGLKATTDRAYVIEAAEVAEVIKRQPVPREGAARASAKARTVRRRPGPTPAPVEPESKPEPPARDPQA